MLKTSERSMDRSSYLVQKGGTNSDPQLPVDAHPQYVRLCFLKTACDIQREVLLHPQLRRALRSCHFNWLHDQLLVVNSAGESAAPGCEDDGGQHHHCYGRAGRYHARHGAPGPRPLRPAGAAFPAAAVGADARRLHLESCQRAQPRRPLHLSCPCAGEHTMCMTTCMNWHRQALAASYCTVMLLRCRPYLFCDAKGSRLCSCQ